MNVIKADTFDLESFQQDYERFDDNDEDSQNSLLEAFTAYLSAEEILAISSDDLFSIIDDPSIDYKSMEDKFYGIVNSVETSGEETPELIVHQNDFGTKVITDSFEGSRVVLFINPEADSYTLFMTELAFKSLFPNNSESE